MPAMKALNDAEALQLREDQLRGILAAASEAILTVDETQTVVMANTAAAEIFGRPPQALLGLPLDALMPERFRARHARAVAAFGAADSPSRRMGLRGGLWGLRANGEEFPLEAGISQAHADGTRLYTVILRDLSASRRASAALRSSEQLLAATFSVSNVGMAQLDPHTRRFVAVNAAYCRLSGHDEAALREMTADAFDHPDDPPCSEIIEALLAGHPHWDMERRLVRADGTALWVQVSLGLARDEAGRPERLVCVTQDITARREALAALRAREARLDFLVRLNDRLRLHTEPALIAHEAACLLGEFCHADRVGYAEDTGDGVTIDVTRNYTRGVPGIEGRYRYLDYGAELLGALRAGRTAVQPDIAGDPRLSAEVKAAHASLQLGATVNVPLLKGGRLHAVFFVHMRGPHHWTPDEVALFEDVAARVRADIERARAETHVRAAKAKLEAALASMSDAVLIADTDGTITDRNLASASFHRLGRRREFPTTMQAYADFLELTLPDGTVAQPSQWAIPRALRGETAANVECDLHDRRTGEHWIGSYSYAPVRDSDGHIVGAVCSARDITDSRRIRTQLEASQAELRRLVAAQDSVQEQERMRIARELHDDLQQNLAAILMEAGVVRSAAQGVDGHVREALDRIERLGTEVIASMRRIVQDLRPQALEELGLVPALQTLADGFAGRTGIACVLDIQALSDAETLRPQTLATCVYRVVQEALNNVARHARARRVTVRLTTLPSRLLAVTVSDDGVGIRAEQLRQPESFGLLGLRERVRALGGSLSVRPGPGGGTTLEALLPTMVACVPGRA